MLKPTYGDKLPSKTEDMKPNGQMTSVTTSCVQKSQETFKPAGSYFGLPFKPMDTKKEKNVFDMKDTESICSSSNVSFECFRTADNSFEEPKPTDVRKMVKDANSSCSSPNTSFECFRTAESSFEETHKEKPVRKMSNDLNDTNFHNVPLERCYRTVKNSFKEIPVQNSSDNVKDTNFTSPNVSLNCLRTVKQKHNYVGTFHRSIEESGMPQSEYELKISKNVEDTNLSSSNMSFKCFRTVNSLHTPVDVPKKTSDFESLLDEYSSRLCRLESSLEQRFVEMAQNLNNNLFQTPEPSLLNTQTGLNFNNACENSSDLSPTFSVYCPPCYDLPDELNVVSVTSKVEEDDKTEQDILTDKAEKDILTDKTELDKIASLMEIIDETHNTDLSLEAAMEAYPIAIQYSMKHLTTKLLNVFQSLLTVHNCFQILRFATHSEINSLMKVTHKLIIDNFKKVSETTADFCNLSFEELCVFVYSDTVCATEEHVFYAIEKWILYDISSRRRLALDLLPAVRVSNCTLQFLQNIRNHFLVCDQIAFHDLVHLTIEELTAENKSLKSGVDLWRRAPPIHHLRKLSRSQESLFILGGDDSGNVIESYSSSSKSWITNSVPDAPSGYTLAVSTDSTIFVVEAEQKRVRSFDPQTKTWTILSPMMFFRKWMCLARDGTRIYVIGGEGHGTRCDYYDTKLNNWTTVHNLQCGRVFASAATLKDKIYCTGGESELGGQILGSVEVYDPSKDSWCHAAPMLGPRWGHCLASCGNFLWAAGGYIGQWRTNDLVRYTPAQNCWTRMRPMPTAKYALSVTVYQGRLYATGGYDVEGISTVEVYNLSTDSWKTGPSLNKAHYWHASCVVKTPIDNK